MISIVKRDGYGLGSFLWVLDANQRKNRDPVAIRIPLSIDIVGDDDDDDNHFFHQNRK